MSKSHRINLFVGASSVLAALSMWYAWQLSGAFPGTWGIVSLCVVAFLLELTPTDLRVNATGSTSFIIHLAAGILFGAFWGGAITAIATLVGKIVQGRSVDRVIFNVAQRTLSIVLAVLVYQQVFDGSVPPSYLAAEAVRPAVVQRDLFLFFVVAATYIFVNVSAVSAAASLSSNRPFREVWHLNVRGLVGYDLAASLLALFVAWMYTKSTASVLGPFLLIVVIVPIVLVRYVYGMYHALQESGQELLQLMVKAIEARDPYTSGHSLRVRELSRAIALELQLSARELEEVEAAALLHDVGKIHEEFAPLLRKESRLTEAETALMQTHALKSAELVGIISKFRGAVQRAVRHHHERWDGQGYPDGLGGSEIPLGSRIILISDTIDAMTTDRPYRKRLPLEVVINELQKCKGTQFDPELVEVAVSSVAVRRLIAGGSSAGDDLVPIPRRSQRLARGSGAFWRLRRA